MATTTQTQAQEQDEQFPLAAQIPLSSFTLPQFPTAASRLRALTLTSDINLNDYQSKHLQAGTFEPSITLPPSITHLTLELFSLGFPAPFLKELAKALPNLQSLTLFSCLIDGLDDRSRKDALDFFKTAASTLRELHIVDTFARVGFWKEVGGVLSAISKSTGVTDEEPGLKVLEVSYTYRGHHESDFLNRTAGEEWSSLVSPLLIGLSLNFASPPEDANEASMQAENTEAQEELRAQDGILPYAADGRASQALRRQFELLGREKAGRVPNLRVLNLSMCAMKANEVSEIVYSCSDGAGGLVGLTTSILLEDKWIETLVKGLAHEGAGSALENLEIVGVPATTESEAAVENVEKLLMTSEASVSSVADACPRLERFEMTILKSRRVGNVVWEKENSKWVMHRNRRTEA